MQWESRAQSVRHDEEGPQQGRQGGRSHKGEDSGRLPLPRMTRRTAPVQRHSHTSCLLRGAPRRTQDHIGAICSLSLPTCTALKSSQEAKQPANLRVKIREDEERLRNCPKLATDKEGNVGSCIVLGQKTNIKR